MKRILFLVLVVTISTGVVACSKGYESQKTAGDVKLLLKAEQYPLVKGDNTLSIAITDSAGKAVTDATVIARFYMPPMPGMAPMESTSQASLKGDKYTVTANVAMEGGWKLDVTETRPGKAAATTTFNVDAR